MTTIDSPPPPPPVAPQPPLAQVSVAPVAPRQPVGVLAVVAFILAALTSIAYLSVKTFVPVVNGPNFDKSYNAIANVFGVLGLLSVVPIIVTIVLGHLSLRKGLGARRGRALGVAAVAIGYLLLALYFNRMIVSIIALIVNPHSPSFLQDNFYWA